MRSLAPRLLAFALVPAAFIGLSFLIFVPSGEAAEVIQFSPEGTVKRVRQVTARFSEPMVPLGDPRATTDPFEVDCAEPGSARWVDSRTWSYDFEKDLPAGVRCRFTLRPRLATLAGAPVQGRQSFAFSTGGPAVRMSRPYDGQHDIDEEQAFVLGLDAPATEASILANVAFSVQGIPERIPVRLVEGPARDALLEAVGKRFANLPVVVLQARRRFPNDAQVRLVWGAGVATARGVASAQDQVLAFKTRRPFSVEFSCERENRNAACVPISPMRLGFSAPIAADQARRIALVGPGGRRTAPTIPDTAASVSYVAFEGPFPEATRFAIHLPAGLTDDARRPLVNAARFPLPVSTAEYPPLAKFSSRFGIVEARSDSALPVTLRNLEPAVRARLLQVDRDAPSGIRERARELFGRVTGRIQRVAPDRPGQMLSWLRWVGEAPRRQSVFSLGRQPLAPREFQLPKPNGARAFEVVGIPMPGPGLYVVELESGKLGDSLLGGGPMYVPTAVLVTNLAVHLKWGREASVVWVTALDTGRPVPGADVAVHTCDGAVVSSGRTDAQGLARIAALPPAKGLLACDRSGPDRETWETTAALAELNSGLFVTARTADDMSFVHSSWNEGIEPWRFKLPEQAWAGPLAVHTVLDRPLFRAGETVSMKHVLRHQTLFGFAHVKEPERPTALEVRHLGSAEKFRLPLAWDAAGIAESRWAIPKEAKLGTYQVVFSRPAPPGAGRVAPEDDPEGEWWPGDDGRREWVSATFRVEEFRVPLMRGAVKLPAAPQVAPSEVAADLAVQYLAGGGAGDLGVTLRTQLRPARLPEFDAFEDFTFANGAVKAGIVRRAAGDEDDSGAAEGADPLAALERGQSVLHEKQDLVLDRSGTARAAIARLPKPTRPVELLAELEFRDPNGEAQTVAASVPLWPAKWLVGIRPDGWAVSRDGLKAKLAVVNVAGKPVAGAPVVVEVFERKLYATRKRLVGGFYGYEHVAETRALGPLCRGVTDRQGLVFCEGKPSRSGNLILQARVEGAGRAVAANREVWVAGSEDWWFEVGDSDRMDVLPEKRRYEPGETARLQVRMPFREATALVTLEREGVLEASVVSLSGKAPVVDLPVKDTWAPNMFVSVLAVRGRAGAPPATAMVDLARPAYKLGIAELEVGWRAHELKVAVTADRPVYRVRESARVKVQVRTAAGLVPPGAEVAVAAVDEGLLELVPNDTWRLLDGMMGRRGHAVRTATAQMQVVGKRHYGLKALPPGGGGGRQATRELFDTLLLWKGRVALDPNGEAVVDVPLNDALTSFRIVAVATSGVGRFGTGATSIRSTQDLMVLPGVAPMVREGDRFRAEVTVRNTAGRAMEVVVAGRVDGLRQPLAPQRVALAAGAASTLGWDLTAPLGVERLRYEIEAGEKGGVTDRVRVAQAVRPAVPVRTVQATLGQWTEGMRQPVAMPADALAGRGGVKVVLGASLVQSLEGVRDWMRAYPYICLEQHVSRWVALRDEARWRQVAATLPAYQDGEGLLKYFPDMWWGSPSLTAYVLSVVHASGWAIPDDVRERALKGLADFVEGRVIRGSPLPTADLSIRKMAALETLSRYGRAEARLLATVAIEPNLWPTSALLDWWAVLHRVPGLPDRSARLAEAERIVRARLNLQGTALGFSTEERDHLWWLMVSADTNAARLIGLLVETGAWQEDVPRLVRGAFLRQRKGAWDTTVSNAWGVLAVEAFARAFEKAPVDGTTTVATSGSARRVEWRDAPAGSAVLLDWPPSGADVTIAHAGRGRPWVTFQSLAAIPLRQPFSSGYRITKTVAPVDPARPGALTRGDRVRVRLEIDAQSDMTWVVVNDPIPAGASHLGTGLARDSQIATSGERAREGRAWLAFEERAFEGFRAYYEYVPKGRFTVEYTIRLNQSGRFEMPTTRVEAMYAPEMLGELPNAPVEVEP